MIIERNKDNIVLKLPKNFNLDALQCLLDLIKYEEITKKSKASQKDIDNLVKSIKKGRWVKTKLLIEK